MTINLLKNAHQNIPEPKDFSFNLIADIEKKQILHLGSSNQQNLLKHLINFQIVGSRIIIAALQKTVLKLKRDIRNALSCSSS